MGIIGKKYGRLTVVDAAGRDAHGNRLWRCICDCGEGELVVSTARLNFGAVKSCGCIRKERPNGQTHGAAIIKNRNIENPMWRTYMTWGHMRRRCDNPADKDYRRYGARGIRYDPRWADFEAFLADMGERPVGMTLERVDNDGHYCKDNCKWATRAEQLRNRNMNTIILSFGGKAQPIGAWAKELGLKAPTIHQRLKRGWPIERVLMRGKFDSKRRPI